MKIEYQILVMRKYSEPTVGERLVKRKVLVVYPILPGFLV